jgi:hypothetical protein
LTVVSSKRESVGESSPEDSLQTPTGSTADEKLGTQAVSGRSRAVTATATSERPALES